MAEGEKLQNKSDTSTRNNNLTKNRLGRGHNNLIDK